MQYYKTFYYIKARTVFPFINFTTTLTSIYYIVVCFILITTIQGHRKRIY